MVGGGNQILQVGTEIGIGEIAVAGAEPGEVEAQRGDAARRKAGRDAARGDHVLAAGEAMREQRGAERRIVRQVQPRSESLAILSGKLQTLAAHGWRSPGNTGLARSMATPQVKRRLRW